MAAENRAGNQSIPVPGCAGLPVDSTRSTNRSSSEASEPVSFSSQDHPVLHKQPRRGHRTHGKLAGKVRLG